MDAAELELFEQSASVAVNDAFRHPCRPRREQHPERVAELDIGELDRARRGGRRRPIDRRRPDRDRGGVGVTGDPHDALHGRKRCEDLRQFCAAIAVLAAEPISRSGDDHLRLELLKARRYRAGTELRRTHRPDRADRCCGEQRDDRFAHVRKDGYHPIAGLDTDRPEMGGEGAHLCAKLGEGDLRAASVLGDGDERHPLVSVEKVARVVQGASWEPARLRHGFGGAHRPCLAAELHPGEFRPLDQNRSGSSTDHCQSPS